jgi:hypothetical protein
LAKNVRCLPTRKNPKLDKSNLTRHLGRSSRIIMHSQFNRRDALKALSAIGGWMALQGVSWGAPTPTPTQKLATGWEFEGKPCVIDQQGSMLILINEIGSVGSGVWTGPDTFTVLSGAGWDAGLVAQVSKNRKTINWSNNTVWTKNPVGQPVQNLSDGWLFENNPCAIFQQGTLLLLVNEVGSIGVGLWSIKNTFVIIGGAGWDLGLVAQVADQGKTITWSNETTWTRNRISFPPI